MIDLNIKRRQEADNDSNFANNQISPRNFNDTVQLNPEIGNATISNPTLFNLLILVHHVLDIS